ncbi:MAG TPA: hypothetical protein VEK11_11895 [Thermoanaerobaculia bacterium]|nr:hypothetical protein [Thermoanaerobaculia bacterium]
MRIPFLRSILAVFLLSVCVWNAGAARVRSGDTAPTVVLESTQVLANGVTPASPVILYGIVRNTAPGAVMMRRLTIVNDADASGAVRFTLPYASTETTIFAVVDYATGRYTIVTPEVFPLEIRELTPSMLRRKGGDYDALDVDARWLQALLVRPGSGAWQIFATDGSALDRDKQSDGRTMLDGLAMTKIAGSGVAERIRHKDVLIVIEPETMRVLATEVPK